jgi:hypothetical protein
LTREWFAEKTARQMTGPSVPGRRRRPINKWFQIIDFERKMFFSTIVFFETGLLGVRNQMKNVFDK